jgi:hypothetical protein
MLKGIPLRGMLLAAILITLCSCSAGGGAPAVQAQNAGSSTGVAGLPAPSALLAIIARQPATANGALYKNGDAFDATLPYNRVTAQADASAKFASLFVGQGSLSQAAYATYRFNVTGFSGALDFTHGWTVDLAADNKAYLGVSNFSRDRWDWFTLHTGDQVAVTDKAAHKYSDGTVLAVVAVIGLSQPRLAALMLNNQPPSAVLATTSPLSGPPGMTVALDGSGSSDADGAIADRAWDPKGSGTFLSHTPPGSQTYQARYCVPGTYHPALRVTDDFGATDTASLTVTVSLGKQVAVTVDNIGAATPGMVSLCEANGKAAVAYTAGADIRYSHATSASGKTWVLPKILATNASTLGLDLEVVGNRPAIAYNTSGLELACIWSGDANGTAWAAPAIAVPYSGIVSGSYPVLDRGADLPRIAYGDGKALFAGDIWFIRATISNLSEWSIPLKLNSATIVGVSPSLAWINGLPAACFSRISGSSYDRLQYTRATSAWDVAWQAALAPLAAGQQTTNGDSLQQVGLKPAIVYKDAVTNKLEYLRATDADGMEWNNQVELPAGAGISDLGFSFQVINGLPCVAYCCNPGGMQIVYATNPAGTAWGAPVVLDASASAAYVSLIDLASRPAVAWVDSNSKKVLYVGFTP